MTAKLVKARPKAVEYLPDWAKCCERFMSETLSQGEMTMDLAVRETAEMGCIYCGANHGILHGVMDIADGKLEALELLDLDEGPTA